MIRCVKLSSDCRRPLTNSLKKSLNVVECAEFRALLNLLRSDLKETMIPHRTKLHQLIIEAWKEHFQALKENLAVSVSAILLIFTDVRYPRMP